MFYDKEKYFRKAVLRRMIAVKKIPILVNLRCYKGQYVPYDEN